MEEKTRLIEQEIRLAERRYLKEKIDSWNRDIEERKKNLHKKYKPIDEYCSINK
jgi:hypothetical protein